MKNLAGDLRCDNEIRRELTRARIEIVENQPARGILKQADLVGSRCVPDKRAAAVRITVNAYHIDSEVGLRIFADAIRSLQ